MPSIYLAYLGFNTEDLPRQVEAVAGTSVRIFTGQIQPQLRRRSEDLPRYLMPDLPGGDRVRLRIINHVRPHILHGLHQARYEAQQILSDLQAPDERTGLS